MKIDRLLVVRLGSMGDVIHALPAVNLLRQAFPAAELHWAIEERWSELLRGNDSLGRPPVDVLHYVNTRAWRKAPLSDETWREILVRFQGMRAAHFDAAVDFQGLLKSAIVTAASGAHVRYGFDDPRERVAAMFYTRRIVRTAKHIVEQNLQLASALAPDVRCSVCFNLPRDPAAEQWCNAELRRRNVTNFALLSPGGGWGAKLWPAAGFAEVARSLAREGLSSIINYGPGEDSLAASIEQESEHTATAMRCSLSELIALTRRATVFIGGDTGPMHLASAVGTPVVALFGPTDPARNGPYGGRSIVLRNAQSATSYSHAAKADEGLLSITASDVLSAVHRLLENA